MESQDDEAAERLSPSSWPGRAEGASSGHPRLFPTADTRKAWIAGTSPAMTKEKRGKIRIPETELNVAN